LKKKTAEPASSGNHQKLQQANKKQRN